MCGRKRLKLSGQEQFSVFKLVFLLISDCWLLGLLLKVSWGRRRKISSITLCFKQCLLVLTNLIERFFQMKIQKLRQISKKGNLNNKHSQSILTTKHQLHACIQVGPDNFLLQPHIGLD